MAITFQGIEHRFAVPELLAAEALVALRNDLLFPMISNRTFQKYMERKAGDTITVNRPFRAKVNTGRQLKKGPMIDKTVTFRVDNRKNFGIEVADEDRQFHLTDYINRYVREYIEEMAQGYDEDGAQALHDEVFFMNGTPGSAATLKAFQSMRAHAVEVAIPMRKNTFIVMPPSMVDDLSQDMQDLEAPALVTQGVRESLKGKLAGWPVLESVNIPEYAVEGFPASGTAPLIDGASQSGTTITTDGWGGNNVKVLRKGTLITIAGVYEVNPRGKRKNNRRLQTFVVTSDVTTNGSAHANIPIYPEINAGTTASTVANPSRQNLDGTSAVENIDYSAFQTVSALPADNAVVTVIGQGGSNNTKDKAYEQAFGGCYDMLEYANVMLPVPASARNSGSYRDPQTGLGITMFSDFDQEWATETDRYDSMYGVKCIYPEMGIRFIGDDTYTEA